MAELIKLQMALASVCIAIMVAEILLGVFLSAHKQCNLLGKYSILSEYSAHLAMTAWSLMSSLDSRAVLGFGCVYLMVIHCCLFYPVLLRNVKLRNSECEPGRHEQVYQIFAVTAVVFSSLLFCLTVAGLIVVLCSKKSYFMGRIRSRLQKKRREKQCLAGIDSNRAAALFTEHYKIRFPVSQYTLSSSLEKAELAYLYRFCTAESFLGSEAKGRECPAEKCCRCLRRTTGRSILLPICRHSYHKLCLLVVIRGHNVAECIRCRHMIRPQIYARMENLRQS